MNVQEVYAKVAETTETDPQRYEQDEEINEISKLAHLILDKSDKAQTLQDPPKEDQTIPGGIHQVAGFKSEALKKRMEIFSILDSISLPKKDPELATKIASIKDADIESLHQICFFLKEKFSNNTQKETPNIILAIFQSDMAQEKAKFFLELAPSMPDDHPLALLQILCTRIEPLNEEKLKVLQLAKSIKNSETIIRYILNVFTIDSAANNAPFFAKKCQEEESNCFDDLLFAFKSFSSQEPCFEKRVEIYLRMLKLLANDKTLDLCACQELIEMIKNWDGEFLSSLDPSLISEEAFRAMGILESFGRYCELSSPGPRFNSPEPKAWSQ